MSTTPPGWYPAHGDPPGTHRYWDGTRWTTAAQSIGAPPPQYAAAPPGPPGGPPAGAAPVPGAAPQPPLGPVPQPPPGQFGHKAEVGMKSHELEYEVFGDDLQFVEIELDPGETVVGEAGTMMHMEDGIVFESVMGDGTRPEQGFWGKVKDAGKRTFTGESIFLTHFTNQSDRKRKIAFAAAYPGKIVPIELPDVGNRLICQKDAFLCAAMGTRLDVAFNRKLGAGVFGGEGFILQDIQGDGRVFVQAGGTVVERRLEGETLRVDTGCLVALESHITYDIARAGNLKSMVFGGEGIFLATLSGTGRVWLQSLPFSRLADRVVSTANMPGRGADQGSVVGGVSNIFERS